MLQQLDYSIVDNKDDLFKLLTQFDSNVHVFGASVCKLNVLIVLISYAI